MGMPNKNGFLDILNHMVRPRNTHGQTRESVLKLILIQLPDTGSTKSAKFLIQRDSVNTAYAIIYKYNKYNLPVLLYYITQLTQYLLLGQLWGLDPMRKILARIKLQFGGRHPNQHTHQTMLELKRFLIVWNCIIDQHRDRDLCRNWVV